MGESSWYQWNTAVRSMSGNYSSAYIGGIFSTEDTTRAKAVAINEEGASSPLLELSKKRLEDMAFFAVLERYDESVQLLAHTFCLDRDALNYTDSDTRVKNKLRARKNKPAK